MTIQLPSSSSRSPFDIFLSFRGDTGKTFTDHLYTALCNAGFRTFRHMDGLQIGYRIEPQLKRAIGQSTISIIVISENYCYSTRCLNELLMILEREKFDDHYFVFPIFYHVEPSEVGKQEGRFERAFDEYEKSGEYSKEETDTWKKALKDISKIAGKVVGDKSNLFESQFINEIVELARRKLERRPGIEVASYTVGIESRVKPIDLWVKDSADLMVGLICGMQGIGKSTIASVAYNLNLADFEASSLLDIRKAFEQEDGVIYLQTRLLSDIISTNKNQKIDEIEEGIVKIQEAYEGFVKIQEAICRKRILLVLDNVDKIEQIEALLRTGHSFHKGSKIIITTSHEELLGNVTHKSFKIKQLDDHESLRLFCWHAFWQLYPKKGYVELSERVARRCEGLPINLQLLGASLFGKNSEPWGMALEKLEPSPEERNRKTLEVSYKLLNENDQRLFLTISSSLVGKDKGDVMKMLEERDFYSKGGMQNLVDRLLISFDEDNKLIMQRLVLDMARAINQQETVDGSGRPNSTVEKTDMDTSEGSLLCKSIESGKHKRLKDHEDESMAQKVASSVKRVCLGFLSLFE